ncbi:MAG: hypothetical protein ACMXYG_04665 [Candidatus Woesearchaeota archaeon]
MNIASLLPKLCEKPSVLEEYANLSIKQAEKVFQKYSVDIYALGLDGLKAPDELFFSHEYSRFFSNVRVLQLPKTEGAGIRIFADYNCIPNSLGHDWVQVYGYPIFKPNRVIVDVKL